MTEGITILIKNRKTDALKPTAGLNPDDLKKNTAADSLIPISPDRKLGTIVLTNITAEARLL
jgi:hypothetical protein